MMPMLFVIQNWKWLLGAVATGVLAVLLTTTTIDRNQWRAAARKGDATIAKFSVAQDAAQKAAQDARTAYQNLLKEKADAGDTHHAQIDTAATTATDLYRADHRVCPASNPGAAGKASSASDDRSASVPASVPTSSFVAVSDADVQACAGAVAYSISAHDWAATLATNQ